MNVLLPTYDYHENVRQYSQWLASSTKTFWENPIFGMVPNPIASSFAAWGKVTERALSRITAKPDWGIESVVTRGSEHLVNIKTIKDLPFCNLLHFDTKRENSSLKKVLLIAPMSGHYATLTRNTVISLLPDCDVYVTDWKNARDVPFSEGKFDVEDFTKYLVDFFSHLSPDLHVIAVCQPAPLALAASALTSKKSPQHNPSTLTLIGGPIDPDANPTEVTDFGHKITMDVLERSVTMMVGLNYSGVGREVYPGCIQLASFIAMNQETHNNAFLNQINKEISGKAAEYDRHNKFYDEYLAVMDMTAEFYLSTVKRIFKEREIARNRFTIDGEAIDFADITSIPTFIIEGQNDDISAPGQCLAALDLLSGLPESMKLSHLQENAGHYGIFSGKAWRKEIRPIFLKFIEKKFLSRQ
jgi:poly(3-hydroxybutyrate) depolymerase